MEHNEYIRLVPGSKTAVVFIHGIMGTPRHFDAFVSLVPKEYSVFNILLDGHGGEVKDFSRTSMSKWEEQTASLVNKLCREYENLIICAHSMGTLFSIDAAIAHPDKVRHLFLLGSPMYIRVAPTAVKNSLLVAFGRVDEADLLAVATKNACSINVSGKIWQYLGWAPRFLELFAKVRKTRRELVRLSVPCVVWQSAHDELVSPRAFHFLRSQNNIDCSLLEDSWHFYYASHELEELKKSFAAICENYK